jgi:hypothetical protein
MRNNLVSALAILALACSLARAQEKVTPVTRSPASPLEVLKKFDISESQFESFFAGQPLGPAEEEILAKILYRWPRLGQENIESWRKKDVSWDQLVAAPADHRAEMFHVRGRVTLVHKVPLTPEIADRLEFSHFYSASVSIHDSPYVAQICASAVPAAWKLDTEMDEPISADGLFLKVGDETAQPPPLIFAAERIAWHPEKAHSEAHVGLDQVALAQAGVDWGLFEIVRAENGHGIGGPDREPFYQTLAVMAGDKGTRLPAATAPIDIPQLLQKSETLLGDRMKVRGTARRVTKVTVEAADIRRRFGIDHYYEIDLSIPLDKPMKVAKEANSKDALLYGNSFPATLIVPKLPENLPEGENVHVVVVTDATFYKLWSYQSSYTSQKNMRQAAPLFMASSVRALEESSPLTLFSSGLVTAAMLLAGGTFIGIYWWFRMSDRASRAASGPTIHDAIRQGAEQAAAEKPDFSGLK